MGVEENKALGTRVLEEVWNQSKMDTIDEIFGSGFTFNFALPGMPSDIDGYKMTVTYFEKAFQDMHITIDEMIGEGDKIAVRWAGRSVHKGEFMGIAPTNKEITTTGISIEPASMI